MKKFRVTEAEIQAKIEKNRKEHEREHREKVAEGIRAGKNGAQVAATTEKRAYRQAAEKKRKIELADRLKKKRQETKKDRERLLRKQVEEVNKDDGMSAKQMAERELASRELARRSLLHYTERELPEYQSGWVHEDIASRLENFVRGVAQRKSPRLMLWVPPRMGKSELASVRLPAWSLGHHPTWEFISSSYSIDLPVKFSRQVRAQLSSDEYAKLFPRTKLAKDRQGVEDWGTTLGGGYRAAGTSGGITGMGAHILNIDDPVKDREEADSDLIRARTWKWFTSTAYTRLAPGGGVLVIQTRWHDDDLSGRLEMQMNDALKELDEQYKIAQAMIDDAQTVEGVDDAEAYLTETEEMGDAIDRWEIVKYPAIATEDEYLHKDTKRIYRQGEIQQEEVDKVECRLLRKKGEVLHPERWPRKLMLKTKRMLSAADWASLYQQDPRPDEGAFFQTSYINYTTHLPYTEGMRIFATWDLAIGKNNYNDFSVGAVGALDWDDNLWLLHLVRVKEDADALAQLIVDIHTKFHCFSTGIERGQLELAIKPSIARVQRETGNYIHLLEGKDALSPITDKLVRAKPLQGRMQAQKLLIPQEKPWTETVVNELLRFPTGVNDDIVDALAWLARVAARTAVPERPKTARQEQQQDAKSWRTRLRSLNHRGNFMSR